VKRYGENLPQMERWGRKRGTRTRTSGQMGPKVEFAKKKKFNTARTFDKKQPRKESLIIREIKWAVKGVGDGKKRINREPRAALSKTLEEGEGSWLQRGRRPARKK